MSDDKEFRARPPEVVHAEALAREAAEKVEQARADAEREAEERRILASGGLLERRGKQRRARQYRGGVPPEQLPEVTLASGATLGGGKVYADCVPVPATPDDLNDHDFVDYDGWVGWGGTIVDDDRPTR